MTLTIGRDIIVGRPEAFLGIGFTPVSTTLADGRIAVVWAEAQFPADITPDYALYTRILAADGSAATDARLVTTTSENGQINPRITALADGGYAVSWVTTVEDRVEGTNRRVYTHDVYARTFSPTGAAEAPEVLVSQPLAGYDPADYNSILYSNSEEHNILGLQGGGAVVVYSYRGDQTWAQALGNDGQPQGQPVQIFDDETFRVTMAQTTSGNVVLLKYNGQLGGYFVRVSGPDMVSAPAGVPGATEPVLFLHDPVASANTGGYGGGPLIAALPGGGFAAVYNYDHKLGADDEVIRIDRYDSQASYLGFSDIPLPRASNYDGRGPTGVVALPGDRLLVLWSASPQPGDTEIMGVIVGQDGTPEGTPQVLNANSAGLQITGQATLLANGDVFLALIDGSGATVGGVAHQVHGQFLGLPDAPPDPPRSETGTDADELLVGGAGNDRLDGAGGNDTLRGQDGADTLLGGTGDDLIFGGATSGDLRDIINGGDGNDTVNAGAGNDEVSGGNGDDLILGDAGSDTLIGNAGRDTLSGGGLSDVIFGGPGDDFLNGGFGFDRLNGGAGADTFYHLGVADHGSDWIQDYDAAGGDVLAVGIAGATRAQFQVNVANTPNAGAAGVDEAFVIYRPTGQILFALVDGDGQASINLQIGGQVFDLLN
jgi:Ca2+-binding RTX toxin-like protein